MRSPHCMESAACQQNDGNRQETQNVTPLSVCSPKTSSTACESSPTPDPKRTEIPPRREDRYARSNPAVQLHHIQAGETNRNIYEENEPPLRHPTIIGRRPSVGIGPIKPGMATKLMSANQFGFGERPHHRGRPSGTIMASPQPCRMRNANSIWMLLDISREK